MQKLTILFIVLPALMLSQKLKTVKGTVTDGSNPLKNAHVYIEGSEIGTYTDKNGSYELMFEEDGILVFSYQGMQSQNFTSDRIPPKLDVVLTYVLNELEEVTVAKSRYNLRSQNELSEAYNVDKDIIKSKYVLIDKKISGFAMEVREGDQINNAGLNILAALQSMFVGVKVSPKGSPNLSAAPDSPSAVIYMRGSGSSIYNPVEAVYDVDGIIYTDPPIFLDINNIERIARVPGLAGTNLYGSIASGGIFIINTKSGNTSPTKEHLAFRAEQRANTPKKIKVISLEQAKKNWPTYLQEFYKATDFESAKMIYEKYEMKYQSMPKFYIDAYQYFSNELNETTFADSIVSDGYELLSKRPESLKALSFIYESQSRFTKENEVVKKLFSLQPNQAHGYLQMANSFRNLNKPQKAISMYARYNYLINDGFLIEDKTGFGPIINRERDNLLSSVTGDFAEDVNESKLKLKKEANEETRLVFEWSNLEAEFDLQFVNPNGQPFTWEHTLEGNSQEVSTELNIGYSIKEFLLDDSLSGMWNVNVTYFGNPSSTPTYLKATVYYDYGLQSQRKEVKVFRLSLKNVNHELFQMKSSSKIAAN